MKSILTKLIVPILIGVFSFGLLGIVPTASADSICDNPNVSAEIKAANGCSGSGSPGTLEGSITVILNSIILVAGLVAVIFVVIGGINYMTSAGDPGKVKKAKDTILYAVIGLVVCALAFAIVNFVISSVLHQGTAADYTTESSCLSAGYEWKGGACK